MSVLKNLLLAVPAQLDELHLSSNYSESNTLQEIQLPFQGPGYPQPPREISTRAAREELRLLVENHLQAASRLRVIDSNKRGTTRFVEIIVGSGSWILRNNDQSELLEIQFTSIHSNITYQEDK